MCEISAPKGKGRFAMSFDKWNLSNIKCHCNLFNNLLLGNSKKASFRMQEGLSEYAKNKN